MAGGLAVEELAAADPGQIDVKGRPLVAKSTPDNDFAPLFGQGVDFRQVLVAERARRHDVSSIRLATMPRERFPRAIVRLGLWPANQNLHSARLGCRDRR
jgi:hypothetical protein